MSNAIDRTVSTPALTQIITRAVMRDRLVARIAHRVALIQLYETLLAPPPSADVWYDPADQGIGREQAIRARLANEREQLALDRANLAALDTMQRMKRPNG